MKSLMFAGELTPSPQTIKKKGGAEVPKSRYAMNETGIWLNTIAMKHHITLVDIAMAQGITSQYLSNITHGEQISKPTRRMWRKRLEDTLINTFGLPAEEVQADGGGE